MTNEVLQLTEEQRRLVELDAAPILCVAPAGCGKTEAVAHRIARFVSSGEIQLPRRALALTFTNRARENLEQRLRGTLGLNWGNRVDVANFHGFATRLIQGHGSLIGLSPELVIPDKVWFEKEIRSLGVNFGNKDSFQRVLRESKSNGRTDNEVLQLISDSNNSLALKFERGLRENGRIDFDDILRYGLQILRLPVVSELYSGLYPLVVVDEIQDLTLDQYELVRLVGQGRTTYAGDREQGIYAFAGARPEEVFRSVEDEASVTVRLTISQRSSPQVLEAVNAIGPAASRLTSANPESFNGQGFVALLEESNTVAEAAQLLGRLKIELSSNDSINTIGIISRRSSRLVEVRRALLNDPDLQFEDWTAPTHNARVVELLYANLDESCDIGDSESGILDHLRKMCLENCPDDEVELRGEIEAALEDLKVRVDTDLTVRQAVDSCRRLDVSQGPVRSGVHLLNAHVGKGQEFDIAVILGLEEGVIPDFHAECESEIEEERRVLHVMLSRAKTGLVLTRAKALPTKYGPIASEQSRWLPNLRPHVTSTW